MRLADMLRGLRSRLSGGRSGNRSLENQNILYFTADTVVQGVMMGGIFSFISVFLVRLGATNLQNSLLTSLPAIVMALASIPCGQFVQKQRNLVRFTTFVRVFHRGSILLVALLPFFTQRYVIEIIIIIWTIKAIANALLESSWMAVVAEVIPPSGGLKLTAPGGRWSVWSRQSQSQSLALCWTGCRSPSAIRSSSLSLLWEEASGCCFGPSFAYRTTFKPKLVHKSSGERKGKSVPIGTASRSQTSSAMN